MQNPTRPITCSTGICHDTIDKIIALMGFKASVNEASGINPLCAGSKIPNDGCVECAGAAGSQLQGAAQRPAAGLVNGESSVRDAERVEQRRMMRALVDCSVFSAPAER